MFLFHSVFYHRHELDLASEQLSIELKKLDRHVSTAVIDAITTVFADAELPVHNMIQAATAPLLVRPEILMWWASGTLDLMEVQTLVTFLMLCFTKGVMWRTKLFKIRVLCNPSNSLRFFLLQKTKVKMHSDHKWSAVVQLELIKPSFSSLQKHLGVCLLHS